MLDNWLDWYIETTSKKVKCLMYEANFARKPMRMLSHLRYEGPSSTCNKGVFLCRRATVEIRKLFNKCGGVAPMYPK